MNSRRRTTVSRASQNVQSLSSDNRYSQPYDWQAGKTLVDSNLYMLTNEVSCDVTIHVGQAREVARAHSYMLRSRSSVFEQILSGSRDRNGEIEEPDVQLEEFKLFLRFIYTDDVMLNHTTTAPLLYLAQKYKVSSLRLRCLYFLSSSIDADNACVIMEQAHLFDEETLYEKAFTFVKENGDATLRSKGVGELCHLCFHKIVMADELNASEDVVVCAALYWSETMCKNVSKEITPKERRNVLGKTIYQIRFPLLDERFFVKNVSPHGILTDVETNTLLQYFVVPQLGVKPFITRPRIGQAYASSSASASGRKTVLPKVDSSSRNQTQNGNIVIADSVGRAGKMDKNRINTRMYTADLDDKNATKVLRFASRDEFFGWTCPGDLDDAISFSCSHNTILKGFLLFGSVIYEEETYFVWANLRDDQERVVRNSQLAQKIRTNPDALYYDLYFRRPIVIEQHRMYTLVVTIEGDPTFQGANGYETVYSGNKTFTFYDTLFSKNGTNLIGGQIPGLIIASEDQDEHDQEDTT